MQVRCNFVLSLSVPLHVRVIQNCSRSKSRHGEKCIYEISPDTLSVLSNCVKQPINAIRFEVFTTVIVQNAVVWAVILVQCGLLA
jgi:hypothetical protein